MSSTDDTRLSFVRVVIAGTVGAGATLLAVRALRAGPPGGSGRWTRTNYGGRSVTLLGGAGVVAGSAAGALAAGPGAAGGVVAALAGGGFGAVDDLTEATENRSKGFRGHVGALARGRLTTGAVKLLGISAASLVAAALATRGGRGASASARVADVATSGALVAGAANLANLLDLRPGRALKVVAAVTAPVAVARGPGSALAAATCGTALAALPSDLAERTMLGDTGANALGAATGVALVLTGRPATRFGALTAVVALTALSERVSFSRVIERTPVLKRIDDWGRAHR